MNPASPYGTDRWRRVRDQHLATHPSCAVTGCGSARVEVHHKVYRGIYPDCIGATEEPGDLVTLCRAHHQDVHDLLGRAIQDDFVNLWKYEDWTDWDHECVHGLLCESCPSVMTSPWGDLERITNWYLSASPTDIETVWACVDHRWNEFQMEQEQIDREWREANPPGEDPFRDGPW